MTVNRNRKSVQVEVSTLDIDYCTLGSIQEIITNMINSHGKDAQN